MALPVQGQKWSNFWMVFLVFRQYLARNSMNSDLFVSPGNTMNFFGREGRCCWVATSSSLLIATAMSSSTVGNRPGSVKYAANKLLNEPSNSRKTATNVHVEAVDTFKQYHTNEGPAIRTVDNGHMLRHPVLAIKHWPKQMGVWRPTERLYTELECMPVFRRRETRRELSI